MSASTPEITPITANQYLFVCAAKVATLTLTKTVVGGLATVADFPLTATTSGVPLLAAVVSGTPAATNQVVPPGAYALSEGAAASYSASAWTCANGNTPLTVSQGTVTVPAGGAVVCGITNTYVPPPVPGIRIVKSSPTATITAAGPLVYDFAVSNTGNVPLTGIVVSDPDCSAPAYVSGDGAPVGELGLAEVWLYTCTRTISQDQIDAGASIANTVSVTSTQGAVDTDTLTIDVAGAPSIHVVKSSSTSLVTAPGPVGYTFAVTNTGNVTLTGVTVADVRCDDPPVYTGGDADTDDKLDLTETWTYTCTRTVVQGEIDAGGMLTNTVDVSSAQEATDSDTLRIPIARTPAISIVKSSATTMVSAPGPVVYDLSVDNTGNVTLTGIVVSDPDCSAPAYVSGDGAPVGELGLAEVWLYTCTRTISQDQIDAGASIANTVSVTSTQGAVDTDTLTIDVAGAPSIHVVKSSSTSLVTAPGPVGYTFTVTNTGNVTLTGVTVADVRCDDPPVYTGGDADTDDKLDLTETWTYTCTRTVVQGEIDAGGMLTNTVDVSSAQEATDSDTLRIPIARTPAISIVKSSATTMVSAPGPVVYDLSVDNTGNVTLTGIVVSDPDCSAPAYVSGDADTDDELDVDETWTFTCTRTVTQAEIDAGGTLANTADVNAAQEVSDTDTLAIPLVHSPSIQVVKSSPTSLVTGAGALAYRFEVRNTGNVTLTGVSVDDPDCDAAPVMTGGDTGSDDLLGLTEIWTFSCVRTVTQALIDGGGAVVNTVTVGADGEVTDSDSLEIPVAQVPALTVRKEAAAGPYLVGSTITYQITVHNSGNVTLSGVVLDDPAATVGTCAPAQPATLAPGADMVCAATHVVSEADGAAGTYLNVVTATGTPPEGRAVRNTGSVRVETGRLPIDLSIDKSLVAAVATGEKATWTITVRNAGPGADSGVVVTDPLPSSLALVSASGTGWSCTFTSGVVRCSYASAIAAGATLPPITIVTTVLAPAGSSLVNGASVTGDLPDPTPANNIDEVSAVVPVVASEPILPETGSQTHQVAAWGLSSLALGIGLYWISRRRRLDEPGQLARR